MEKQIEELQRKWDAMAPEEKQALVDRMNAAYGHAQAYVSERIAAGVDITESVIGKNESGKYTLNIIIGGAGIERIPLE